MKKFITMVLSVLISVTCTTNVIAASAEQTINASNQTIKYGSENNNVNAKVTGNKNNKNLGALSYAVKSDSSVTVDGTTGELTIVDVGETVITITAAEKDQYASTTKDITVTINKKEIVKPTAVSKTYTYDGNEQTFELNGFDSDLIEIENNKKLMLVHTQLQFH